MLDGVDEGVYGWVTVNANVNAFVDDEASTDAADQVGVLDWGGASAQVSFPPASDLGPMDDVRNIKVYKRENPVYSITHLCYGQHEALNRYFVQVY